MLGKSTESRECPHAHSHPHNLPGTSWCNGAFMKLFANILQTSCTRTCIYMCAAVSSFSSWCNKMGVSYVVSCVFASVCVYTCELNIAHLPPSPSLSLFLLFSDPLSLPSKSEDEITVKEAQVTRLQSTVERMLKESDAHVKTHLTQRKLLTDEKVSTHMHTHTHTHMHTHTHLSCPVVLLSDTDYATPQGGAEGKFYVHLYGCNATAPDSGLYICGHPGHRG